MVAFRINKAIQHIEEQAPSRAKNVLCFTMYDFLVSSLNIDVVNLKQKQAMISIFEETSQIINCVSYQRAKDIVSEPKFEA